MSFRRIAQRITLNRNLQAAFLKRLDQRLRCAHREMDMRWAEIVANIEAAHRLVCFDDGAGLELMSMLLALQ
jgi:hypothetical protein